VGFPWSLCEECYVLENRVFERSLRQSGSPKFGAHALEISDKRLRYDRSGLAFAVRHFYAQSGTGFSDEVLRVIPA
jgi:hypothetical protein